MHTYIQFHIPALWEALVDKKLLKIANRSKWENFKKSLITFYYCDGALHTGSGNSAMLNNENYHISVLM